MNQNKHLNLQSSTESMKIPGKGMLSFDFETIPVVDPGRAGTRIFGVVSYAGISKNLKEYFPQELAQGNGVVADVLLNHALSQDLELVPDWILPDSYRQRLLRNERIVLGKIRLYYDVASLTLYYRALIWDEFYRQKKILENMSVSQGILHFEDLEHNCDEIACYKKVEGSEYREVSLVFFPGFSHASISFEESFANTSLSGESTFSNQMSAENTKKTTGQECDDCPKGIANETQQTDMGVKSGGIPPTNGQCGEGKIWSEDAQMCIEAPEQPPLEPSAPGVEQGPSEDDDKQNKDAKDKKESAESTMAKLKKIGEELAKIASEESASYDGPNADVRQRREAQEAYVNARKREQALKTQQAHESAKLLSIIEKQMTIASESAKANAMIGSQYSTGKVSGVEAAEQGVVDWIKKIVSNENHPLGYSYTLNPDYTSRYVQKRFKEFDKYGYENYVPYQEKMKHLGLEAQVGNIIVAGGADPENYMRTMSELVLVYPDGDIVTPIQQFCETKILKPGEKEALFPDMNKPTFADTDEATMNAASSGFALAPSDLTINFAGGKTNPKGSLVRVGYTNLEEVQIDLASKINIGFSMASEAAKNAAILGETGAYNDDTAYNPATDAKKPKGGGAKHVADTKGNTHWVNGGTGAQLASAASDIDATILAADVLKFKGILEARRVIKETGITTKPVLYTTVKGMNDVLQDSTISNYVQRSVPEVITEGEIERLAGVSIIETSDVAIGATGGATPVRRSVMFVPQTALAFVTGRELQMKAEDVARDQSVYFTGSHKVAGFVKKVELTCRLSHR